MRNLGFPETYSSGIFFTPRIRKKEKVAPDRG